MDVNPALGGAVRPWNVQRYYDWRKDSFVLPDKAARRAITTLGDQARGIILAGEADMKKPAE